MAHLLGTGKPIWETLAGDLGTIQEGKFYQLTLTAYEEGSSPKSSSTLYYTMIAGELPSGIQCTRTGLIEGVPKAVSSVQGVPTEVGENVTSKFTVRVFTENEDESIFRVADRTFTVTVTGQDIPQWSTAAGSLGTFIDGQSFSKQLEYQDPDPGQTVTTNLLSGNLPPGITLSGTGLLSGVLLPVVELPDDALPGYDVTPFDKYGLDIATRSSSQNYQFTIEVTDGKDSNVRTWTMYVHSRDDITADSDSITADDTFFLAGISAKRTPYLTTPSADLGTVRHDNFYAYKFSAIDTDGDPLEYSITTGEGLGFDATDARYDEFFFDRGTLSLPPGLAIEPTTGWFYGYIPNQGLTEATYTFGIQVKKRDDPTIISPLTFFTIKIIGEIDTEVTWTTPTTTDGTTTNIIGKINNGEISKLNVKAQMLKGSEVEYRLKTGTNSSLPPGLTLLTSGNIVGMASFQGFTLDNSTTTFDEALGTRLVVDPTTFDRTYTFTVEAYNAEKQISTTKIFNIIITQKYARPYETLYVKALTEKQDRDTLTSLLDNQDIFNSAWLYRSDDPNFGKATSVTYQHAFGLYSSSLDDYVTAMQLNHYKKDLTLGQIKTAQALDVNNNVIYEVVYSEINGGLLNNTGKSVSLEVTLDKTANINGVDYTTVYPASLLNMQTRLINKTGQFGEILPDWMKSKQTDGTVLGFKPAWVIAYTIPGKSKQIAYNITQEFTSKLNIIDFTIDRYIIDRRASQHWDFTNKKWLTGLETTFDDLGITSTLTFKQTVDLATTQAFIDIDGKTLTYLTDLGGIDGKTAFADLNGKTVVFVKQEGFATTTDVAFTDRTDTVIPGPDEAREDSTENNDRMSVYTISIDSATQVISLTKTTDRATNDYIKINNGITYGSNFLYFPTSPATGLRNVNWQFTNFDDTTQTLFDGGSTRLISKADTYVSDDKLDKYVLYPKHNIIGNEDYIENG